jgi:hypothetical protein
VGPLVFSQYAVPGQKNQDRGQSHWRSVAQGAAFTERRAEVSGTNQSLSSIDSYKELFGFFMFNLSYLLVIVIYQNIRLPTLF